MAKNGIKGGRIALDARGAIHYRGTGIGTYTYQLAVHLRKLVGEEISFFLPGQEYEDLDFTDSARCTRIQENPRYCEEEFLPCWLKEQQAVLYHVPQNGIGLPLAAPCRTIVTIHDLIPYVYPESVGRGYRKEFLHDMPAIIGKSDGIIAVSNHTKRDILRFFKYPEDRIAVIYEAAEPIYALTASETCKGVLRRQYGIDGAYLLYVGGFSRRKNLSGLLTAFARAQSEWHTPYLLVCPGRCGRETAALTELATSLGIGERVVFPGFVPGNLLPYFYGGASALVYPSFYEGFGLPVLEAMACGCPVLVADNSSLRETGGDAACYFDAMDTDSMTRVLVETLNDPKLLRQMGQKGLAWSARFDWQKTAEATLAFYEKILALPSRSGFLEKKD